MMSARFPGPWSSRKSRQSTIDPPDPLAVGRGFAVVAVACVLGLGSPSSALADEFLLFTPRAIGMGGAYTALASGAEALPWNPAGLSYSNKIQAEYAQSGFTDDSGKMKDALDPLRRTNPADPFLYENPGRTSLLAGELAKLDGLAARDFKQTSWILAGDKWALGYSNLQHWLLKGVSDLRNVDPVPPETSGSIANNTSAVDAYRLHMEQYTIALSFLTPQDPFTFGFALHHHRGGVRFARLGVYQLLSNDPVELMRTTAQSPREDSTDWSFDVGVLVPMKTMRLGIVVRNLLFNKFPVMNPPEGADTELGPGPQVRIGLGYEASKTSVASVDLDLTNDSVLGADRKTRGISLGYERWMTSWLALRSGTEKIFGDSQGFLFSLGTSVRLPIVTLDVGGRINRGGGFDEVVGGATVSF